MKDTKVESIANKLGVSVSTVSKAIRHCSGVDSETRQRILAESRQIHVLPHSDCPIYTILPDVPQYFWRELRKGIQDGSNADIAPVKANIYTKPRDEETVLEYLDEAEKLNARVIILATHITPAIHEKLETLTQGRLVILLSEYHEVTNSFYVGGNAYEDGYTMGQQYVAHYADRKLVCVATSNNNNATRRIEGFYQAVREANPKLLDNALSITLDQKMFRDLKLLPSKLAPLLAGAAKDEEQICIYSPTGIPQLPLALIKAKLTEKTVCLCHDCVVEHPYEDKNMDMGFAITCNQDVRRQGRAAIKIATEFVKENLYPEKKKTYIPSILNSRIGE